MKGIVEWVKGGCGTVVALFCGMHYMIQLLVWAITMDVVTGLIVGWVERRVSSEVSRRGMARKAVMLLAVGGAELVSQMTGVSVVMPWGAEFSLGAALAGYYCVQEALSITENIHKVGVPLPKFITKRLESLKEVEDVVEGR